MHHTSLRPLSLCHLPTHPPSSLLPPLLPIPPPLSSRLSTPPSRHPLLSFPAGEAPALEFLAMVGTIATGISAFQAGVLETQTLKHPFSATQAVLLLLFALALLSFYSGAPVVIVRAGAAFLNLSLLSSQLWATVARIALFGGFPSPLAALAFAVSLSVTAAGLVTFSLADREQELLQSYEHVLPETHPGGRGDARGCRADSDEAACGRAGSLGASPVDCSTRVCDAETRRGAGKGRRVGAAEEEMASLDRAMCVEGMADVAPDGTSCGGAAGHLRGIGRSLVGRGGVDDPPDDVSRQGLLGQ